MKSTQSAFPQPIHHPDLGVLAQPGMTLRDYFAAKAMQGMMARGESDSFVGTAGVAYAIADAMLKERDK